MARPAPAQQDRGTGRPRASTVEFDHVTKHYDAAAVKQGAPGAVDDLTLQVPAGTVCVLVGPSGCGKTTSLKMVNRLIEPTSGRILLDGVDAGTREVTELRRGIGYVIQQIGLFPHQTIGENVATVPRLLGWPGARQRARSDELLTLVGLDPARYRDRYPAQLSGGERQRVGVARALAADPPIMLMDEPFGAVDPIVRDRLQNEFLRLQEDLAKTILFVTHDIDEAIKMGDMVVVMQAGGRVAQVGSPAEILARPASDFVARFVGADRGLKRLSLFRVDDIPLAPAVTAQVGEPAAAVRRRVADAAAREVLLVDDEQRPTGWVMADDLPGEGAVEAALADPSSPLMDRRTTLKDAMSMLLDQDVQSGIVVDRTGRLRGLLTLGAIIDWMRDERSRQTTDAVVQAAAEATPITAPVEPPSDGALTPEDAAPPDADRDVEAVSPAMVGDRD